MDEQRRPGLAAVYEARDLRKSGRWPAIPPRFWLWTATVLVAWGIFYWKRTQGEIESAKAKLFARQRAVAAELAPRFEPLRKAIEDWTVEAAQPNYPGDKIAPSAKTWDFAGQPGIYLRLRMADVGSAKTLRKAANDSLHDGFTACFFHVANQDPTSGPPCRMTHDCPAGSFCNEVDHCTPPAQPFNMRAAYRGTRILTDDWTVDLRTADSDVRMRLLEREFEAAVNDDVPLAIDLMTRAQFYLLVLDEDPKEGVAPPDADAGGANKIESTRLEAVQAVAHPARVFLWKLKGDGALGGADRELVRLRRDVDARFMPIGEAAVSDPQVLVAEQRQVNSCQLALSLREALAQK